MKIFELDKKLRRFMISIGRTKNNTLSIHQIAVILYINNNKNATVWGIAENLQITYRSADAIKGSLQNGTNNNRSGYRLIDSIKNNNRDSQSAPRYFLKLNKEGKRLAKLLNGYF